jgi:electron transfer flavoprotein beta subunit
VNIIVCVKKVPEIDQVTVKDGKAESSGTGMTNPFDMYAIEEAIRLKEKTGDNVYALTFGPQDSEFALREALSLGADSAVRIPDDDVSASDIMAGARILASAIAKIGDVKVVLFGKQAVDDDASSVPAAVAGFLNWPQILFVKKIREFGDESITAERATEDGFDVVEASLPAVISVVKEINEPRLPSLKGKMKARKAKIEVMSLSDIGLEKETAGAGSPSRLIEAKEPPPRPRGEILEGITPEELADKLVKRLKDNKII